MPVVYDIETYPNCFQLCAADLDGPATADFEISERRNDRDVLMQWLQSLASNGVEMIGFNNVNFDYPVIHHMMNNPTGCTERDAYDKAQQIITGNDRFGHIIWPSDRYIPQIDLFKIHHFDNKARSTSLKALQVAMRSDSVEDLPIAPGTVLTFDQMEDLMSYCMHDVMETKRFALESGDQIAFRRELSEKYNRDFMNHNDTKIGKDYFIMRLEEAGMQCFERGASGRQPKQTGRASGIDLSEVVFPYVQFESDDFNRVVTWLKSQRIYETKGVFSDLSATVNGFTFDFGTGGIHGSVRNRIVREGGGNPSMDRKLKVKRHIDKHLAVPDDCYEWEDFAERYLNHLTTRELGNNMQQGE